jgi:hypothetical protein
MALDLVSKHLSNETNMQQKRARNNELSFLRTASPLIYWQQLQASACYHQSSHHS